MRKRRESSAFPQIKVVDERKNGTEKDIER